MNDRIREQLLGYLLDALDDAERIDVEQQLEVNPELRDELESLALTLEPLAETYEEFLNRQLASQSELARWLPPALQ